MCEPFQIFRFIVHLGGVWSPLQCRVLACNSASRCQRQAKRAASNHLPLPTVEASVDAGKLYDLCNMGGTGFNSLDEGHLDRNHKQSLLQALTASSLKVTESSCALPVPEMTFLPS